MTMVGRFVLHRHLAPRKKLRNVIEFVNCYETRNHLWVIFEYCAGGDLLRLLKQDSRPSRRKSSQECKSFGGLLAIWKYTRVLYLLLGKGEIIYIQAV